MKCPLFVQSYMLKTGAAPTHQCDCLKEECAWWNEYFGKCCVAVSSYLKGIEGHRLEIKQTMRDRD